MKRDEALHKTEQIICNDRENQYGSPEQSHTDIAALWTTYLNSKYKQHITLTATDAALMMILFKMARTFNGNTEDTYLDMVGYAAISAELASSKNELPCLHQWQHVSTERKPDGVTTMTSKCMRCGKIATDSLNDKPIET